MPRDSVTTQRNSNTWILRSLRSLRMTLQEILRDLEWPTSAQQQGGAWGTCECFENCLGEKPHPSPKAGERVGHPAQDDTREVCLIGLVIAGGTWG